MRSVQPPSARMLAFRGSVLEYIFCNLGSSSYSAKRPERSGLLLPSRGKAAGEASERKGGRRRASGSL